MSNPRYIAALDQGTTSSRCLLFDEDAQIVSIAQQEIERSFPHPGWVQQDATEIWASQLSVFTKALTQAQVQISDIAAIGITNQRETTIVWDRHTGKPVYDALVWQCRRGASIIDEIAHKIEPNVIQEKTGLILDSYFSASKIAWILREIPGARARAEAGDLLFGTVDTWLLWNLTGGAVHATDMTNASRTLLYNIHTCEWDNDLLRLFDIPRSMLPEVKPSCGYFGHTDNQMLGHGVPIMGVAGDQQAALFGQCCFEPGDVKNTYGTGCFLLMNTGGSPVRSSHGLLSTIAYADSKHVTYALEGSIFNAGSAIDWLKDGLELIRSVDETEALARSVNDTQNCYVVPAFNGLGAPYWDTDARGAIVGLTQGVTRAHVVRATLESLAYQTYDVLRAMQLDAGTELKTMRVDGGVSRNNFCMQFQSDILGERVIRPCNTESTALGAAFIAGLSVGFWENLDDVRACCAHVDCFEPTFTRSQRERLLAGWDRAVHSVLA